MTTNGCLRRMFFSGCTTVLTLAIAVSSATAQFAATTTPAQSSTISGTVTDASGAPAAGVSVMMMPNLGAGQDVRTDDQGHYSLTWRPANVIGANLTLNYYVLARDPDKNLIGIAGIDPSATNQDLQFRKGLALSGKVTDPSGKGLPGAQVQVMIITGSIGVPFNRQPVLTDAEGNFKLSALPRGMQYNVTARADGYGNSAANASPADTDTEQFSLPAIVLRPANRPLAGQVLDADGKPLPNAQVQLIPNGPGAGSQVIRADAQGHFETKVTDGVIRVTAIGPATAGVAQSGWIQAQAGDTNIVVRIAQGARGGGGGGPGVTINGPGVAVNGPPVTITGTVRDSSGTPAAGVHVSTLPARTVGSPDIVTDSEGHYSLTWQPFNNAARGRGTAASPSLIARDVEHNQIAFEAIDDKTTKKDLRLVPGLTLSGTVQDQYNAPVLSATLQLVVYINNVGSTFERQPIRMDDQGGFSVAALPQGTRLTLQFRADNHGSVTRQLPAEETAVADLKLPTVVLNLADQIVAGTVVNSDNRPIAGAQVQSLGTAGQPNVSTRSDARGHFELKVCAGRVQLFAIDPTISGTTSINPTAVNSGDTNIVLKVTVPQPPTTVATAAARTINAANRAVLRNGQFKPQVMTMDSLKAWPGAHRKALVLIGIFQAVLLVAVGGGIFWAVRPERAPSNQAPANGAPNSP